VAGTVALLACERPKPRPPQPITGLVSVPYEGGRSEVPAPCPSSGIVNYYGKRWKLADMPGRLLVCLDLRGAEWFGVDLHHARFVGCDFARLWKCDLRGVDLTGADLTRTQEMGDTSRIGSGPNEAYRWLGLLAS
jgi:hypothetical protein